MIKTYLLILTALLFFPTIGQNQELNWTNQIGSTGDESCSDIAYDNNGNIYLTGQFRNTIDFDSSPEIETLSSAGSSDAFIQKIDLEGNLVWAKRIGGTGIDGGDNIFVDSAGFVFVSGFYSAICDFDPNEPVLMDTATGPSDIFLEKLDPLGNLVWYKTFDGSYFSKTTDLQLDTDGNIYISGYFSDSMYVKDDLDTIKLQSNGTQDGFLIKFNAEGEYQWNKVIGGETGDNATGIIPDKNGNIYLTGKYSSTVDFEIDTLTSVDSPNTFYIKYNSEGIPIWLNDLIGSNAATPSNLRLLNNKLYAATSINDIHILNPTEEAIILGYTATTTLAIQCFNLDGTPSWIKILGKDGGGSIQAVRLSTYNSNHLLLTGLLSGAVDLDITEEELIVDYGFGLTAFIYKLDTNGVDFSFITLPNEEILPLLGEAVTEDQFNNVYLCGYFNGTVDFDPSETDQEYTSEGSSDAFISKFSFSTATLPFSERVPEFSIYPNPFNSNTTIYFDENLANDSQVMIHNTLGQKVSQYDNLSGSKLVITKKELEKGVYLVSLIQNNKRSLTKKLIVQ